MALETTQLDNDTRGWIMCIVSGIACVVGASVICVDCIVRLFPGKKNFRIQDSNAFLAASLSLSFGVMLFSSLYSMLPESKSYLKGEDWSDQTAGLLSVGCFIAGFFGIQAISRLLHRYMPSHVVDCDHTHEGNTLQEDDHHNHNHGRKHSRPSRIRRKHSRQSLPRHAHHNGHDHDHDHGPDIQSHEHLVKDTLKGNGAIRSSESTPLLASDGISPMGQDFQRHASTRGAEMSERPGSPPTANRLRPKLDDGTDASRRTSMLQVQKRVMSFVKDTKPNCDELGSCYGFTDPCGRECFKHISSRQSTLRTTATAASSHGNAIFFENHQYESGGVNDDAVSPRFRGSRATSRDPVLPVQAECDEEEDAAEEEDGEEDGSCSQMEEGDDDIEAQHHHHVPTNAFLSIGLQTSIAIALHKFPEGFITYATNHANPSLGFNVFMALFVHNITEGFAMALPLYMALGSRWRAMAWSTLLGGFSQPIGAGIAALWFKLAKKTHMTPDAVAYGCLFAVTAGIMVSVALQLFVESLSLNHNRNTCMFFGFLGMAILGVSNAIFASH